jgi:hypothetical protein
MKLNIDNLYTISFEESNAYFFLIQLTPAKKHLLNNLRIYKR